MLVIVIALAGLIWQRDAVQYSVMSQIGELVGTQGASFVTSIMTTILGLKNRSRS